MTTTYGIFGIEDGCYKLLSVYSSEEVAMQTMAKLEYNICYINNCIFAADQYALSKFTNEHTSLTKEEIVEFARLLKVSAEEIVDVCFNGYSIEVEYDYNKNRDVIIEYKLRFEPIYSEGYQLEELKVDLTANKLLTDFPQYEEQ